MNQGPSRSDTRRVLVVEDDETIRHVIAEALREDGYDVREASCGNRALDVLAVWSPQVILLDVMMPGMDGAEFRARQQARGLAVDVPIIVVSASRDAVERARSLGATRVVMKPFDLSQLLDLVEQVLRTE